MRVIENKKVTETQEFDRFGSRRDVIHYSCGLLNYIDYRMILRVFGGGPYPPYIVREAGLQVG